MNSHNEEKKFLTFGKKKIDVSNIAYGRIVRAAEVWNETVKKEGVSVKRIQSMIETVGLYLIRQEFRVLHLRYSFFRSIIEYIKRLLLTKRHIRRSNKAEYEEFENWIYFNITGKKKESLERQKGILDLIEEMVVGLEKKTNLDLERCLELLQTSVGGIVEQLSTSTQDLKA